MEQLIFTIKKVSHYGPSKAGIWYAVKQLLKKENKPLKFQYLSIINGIEWLVSTEIGIAHTAYFLDHLLWMMNLQIYLIVCLCPKTHLVCS
jgi:hypothetical protein